MKIKTYRPPNYNILRRTLSRITGKNFAEPRKPKYKIERHDTWSIEHTLSPIIYRLLKQHKETAHSYPAKFVEYRENEWKNREDYDNAVKEGTIDPGGIKKWESILDEMIWSFEQLSKDDYEDGFHHGTIDFELKPIENTNNKIMELVQGPNHTHTFDEKGYREHMKKIQRGIDLFAEYFMDLWD